MVEPLLRNWPLKLLSVALAFAIWVAVTGEGRIVRDFRVPVDLDLAEGIIAAEAPPTTVSVRLRGPETVFRRLDPLPLELRVDLRDAAAGAQSITFDPGHLRGVPQGVEVATIEPDRFRVVLDRKARKTVPVVPAFSGQAPRGYAVYGVRVSPDGLEVEGPAARVADLHRLRTDPIPLADRKEPFSVRVHAAPVLADVRLVNPSPLEVRVDIGEAPATGSIRGIPVVLRGRAFEATSSPETVTAEVSAPPGILRSLDARNLRAVADVSDLAPRREPYHVPVRVEVVGMSEADGDRISVKSFTPDRVAVAVSARKVTR